MFIPLKSCAVTRSLANNEGGLPRVSPIRAHKDFWTQKMQAKFLFAKMMLKVFLITCIRMKIDLEVIISLQITYILNQLISPKFSGSIVHVLAASRRHTR